MAKTPRPYQAEAAEAAYKAIIMDEECHPVVAIPTGSGKTMVMCEIIDHFLSGNPTGKALVLSHVSEILEQNYDAISEHFDGLTIGLYSAGLGSRTTAQITVAGIQSIHKKADLFEDVGIIIIDECHLVNTKNLGMYRTFLSECEANYVGLTATHFRTGHGYIHVGDEAIFNKLAYNLCTIDGFKHLIDNGWLCPLIAKGTGMKLNTTGLKTRMNEYVSKEMSGRFDREAITNQAVDEIIDIGQPYNKWLVFAIDIKHAENVAKTFNKKGIKTGIVHSKMKHDRKVEIDKFKSGGYRCLVNVDVLTTGFDDPEIDLIAMLRPTQSPILHIQSLGRGMRVSPTKDHCLVLDFAGNCARLGPINDVEIKQIQPTNGEAPGGPRMKECHECQGLVMIQAKECEWCGFVFPVKEKIQPKAYEGDIIKTKIEKKPAIWMDVTNIKYHAHAKPGKPLQMKVSYLCGLKGFHEYICYDHPFGTYPKHKADNWVKFRLPPGIPMPYDCEELIRYATKGKLGLPTKVQVQLEGRFPSIEDVQFG